MKRVVTAKKVLIGSILAILVILLGVWLADYSSYDDEVKAYSGEVPSLAGAGGNSGGLDEQVQAIPVGAGSTCNAKDGYESCYYNSETQRWGCAYARARAKIHYNGFSASSVVKGGYIVGNAQVNFDCSLGDEATYELGTTTHKWDQCGASGCSGDGGATKNTVIAATAPYEGNVAIAVYCHDYDYDECYDGSWAWSWAGAGFSSSWNNIKVVRCYDNDDCDGGKYCDKTGNWKEWSCKTDPCAGVSATSCVGDNLKSNPHKSGNSCVYDSTYCDFGCSGGVCNPDPCAGVSCPVSCSNAVAKTAGYCDSSNGVAQCKYTDKLCTFGCEADACKKDPCSGVVCANNCNNGVRKYDGQCDSSSGAAICQYSEELCEYSCEGTFCRGNPCSVVDVPDKCELEVSYVGGLCTPSIDGLTFTVDYVTMDECNWGCNVTSAMCLPNPSTSWFGKVLAWLGRLFTWNL